MKRRGWAVVAASLASVLLSGLVLAQLPVQAPAGPGPAPGAPLLTLTAAGSDRAVRGWPLLVTLRVAHPDAPLATASAAPIVLAPGLPSWCDSVRLDVTGPDGAGARWPLHRVTAGAPTVKLDARRAGFVAWYLTAEETATLAPGLYRLTATLEVAGAKAGGSWKGNATSEALELNVEAEPTPLPPDRYEEKIFRLADYAMLRGEPEKALAAVEGLLARQSDNVGALMLKGDLLAAAGQLKAARAAYDAALAAFRAAASEGKEPPTELLRRRAAVAKRLRPARQ